MIYIATSLIPALDLLARGGGGGSGGGGGGGGIGGVGSLIFLMGYVPTYYTSTWLNKHTSRLIGIIVGSVVGLVVTIVALSINGLVGFGVGVGAIAGVWMGVNNLISRLMRGAMAAGKAQQLAASTDPAWQEAAIQTRIQTVFQAFQRDWSSFDLASIKTYTTEAYYNHVRLMLMAIYQMGRRNNVDHPTLKTALVVAVSDQADNTRDSFKAFITAEANDQQIDTVHNQIIYTDTTPFEELWSFSRINDQWMLAGIDQATANQAMASSSLQQFADQNQLYYSLDWGWLLLPQRGQLFGQANFKNSDINNHVIGQWGNLIIQLYTYIPAKASQRADNYLIGQINLPKTYGGIIIKRRGKLSIFSRTPKAYTKVSFEWPDFNARYDVYATDMERVTAFELLNPAVMAKIYDLQLPINIEVVDNLVYFYCLVTKADQRYADMLTVLQLAYQELRQ